MKHLRAYHIKLIRKGQWLISARFGYDDWDRYACGIESLRCVVPKLRARGYVREKTGCLTKGN